MEPALEGELVVGIIGLARGGRVGQSEARSSWRNREQTMARRSPEWEEEADRWS